MKRYIKWIISVLSVKKRNNEKKITLNRKETLEYEINRQLWFHGGNYCDLFLFGHPQWQRWEINGAMQLSLLVWRNIWSSFMDSQRPMWIFFNDIYIYKQIKTHSILHFILQNEYLSFDDFKDSVLTTLPHIGHFMAALTCGLLVDHVRESKIVSTTTARKLVVYTGILLQSIN